MPPSRDLAIQTASLSGSIHREASALAQRRAPAHRSPLILPSAELLPLEVEPTQCS